MEERERERGRFRIFPQQGQWEKSRSNVRYADTYDSLDMAPQSKMYNKLFCTHFPVFVFVFFRRVFDCLNFSVDIQLDVTRNHEYICKKFAALVFCVCAP